jgi:hypothetical protein
MRLTPVFIVIVSLNNNQPIVANTITPIEKPRILDSHIDPSNADMK